MFFGGVMLAISLAVLQIVESAPLEEEKIEVVGLSYLCIHSKVPGKPHDKSPVLLIHGMTSSLKDWEGIHQALAIITNRRVCAVDLRNHGNSAWNNRSDVEALTADIINFLDLKGIKKVNIVGHSLGGKTAVNCAIKNPERVDSIVVEDMRPNGVTETASKLVAVYVKFMRTLITEVPATANLDEARNILAGLIQNKISEAGANETINKNILQIRRDHDSGKWQWKANLDLMDRENYIEDILTPITGVYEGPALFIYGAASPFDVGGDRDNIIKLFPNAKLIPVEGAGHSIHGKFTQFQDEVIKFLNSLK